MTFFQKVQLIINQPDECKPEIMKSEDHLFLLYTLGSTGKPKGVQHSQAGHIYIVYGSLAAGAYFYKRDIK